MPSESPQCPACDGNSMGASFFSPGTANGARMSADQAAVAFGEGTSVGTDAQGSKRPARTASSSMASRLDRQSQTISASVLCDRIPTPAPASAAWMSADATGPASCVKRLAGRIGKRTFRRATPQDVRVDVRVVRLFRQVSCRNRRHRYRAPEQRQSDHGFRCGESGR